MAVVIKEKNTPKPRTIRYPVRYGKDEVHDNNEIQHTTTKYTYHTPLRLEGCLRSRTLVRSIGWEEERSQRTRFHLDLVKLNWRTWSMRPCLLWAVEQVKLCADRKSSIFYKIFGFPVGLNALIWQTNHNIHYRTVSIRPTPSLLMLSYICSWQDSHEGDSVEILDLRENFSIDLGTLHGIQVLYDILLLLGRTSGLCHEAPTTYSELHYVSIVDGCPCFVSQDWSCTVVLCSTHIPAIRVSVMTDDSEFVVQLWHMALFPLSSLQSQITTHTHMSERHAKSEYDTINRSLVLYCSSVVHRNTGTTSSL